jgi:hypothetical protein
MREAGVYDGYAPLLQLVRGHTGYDTFLLTARLSAPDSRIYIQLELHGQKNGFAVGASVEDARDK